MIISIIIGGRLGYVIFYNPVYYIDNPIDILKIWEGGMSFHGGLIGVVVGTYFFSRRLNLETFIFLDVIACVSPIGLFLGRVANFINGELFGKPTDVSWAVVFSKTDMIPRHPSQLYEAFLEGILLFLILIPIIYNKNIKTGFSSGFFLILYGFFRILSEQFREPDEHIGNFFDLFSMGSILSSIMIIAGTIILIKIKK